MSNAALNGRLVTEILPHVFAVPVRQSTAFLVVETSVTLIDAGAPGSAGRILAALAAIGRAPEDIACVVITHAHLDHVGGLQELQRSITAPAAAHVLDAPAIRSPRPLPNPFRRRSLAFLTQPVLARIDPGAARIDVALEDGDPVPGSIDLFVVHLPGHTAGSIAVHARQSGVVFAGDAMEYRYGRLGPPNRFFTRDMEQARASIRRLSRLDIDALCFSHFPAIKTGAGRMLRDYVDSLEAA